MSNTKNVPGYLSLVMKVLTAAKAGGHKIERDKSTNSSLPENRGFCFVFVDGGNAALIIPKHAGTVKWCDSHIDWKGKEGYLQHPTGDNGTVACRIDPAKVDLAELLKGLSGASRRDKKGTQKASKEATESLLATLQAFDLDDDSEAPVAATPGVTVRKPEMPVSDDIEADGQFE